MKQWKMFLMLLHTFLCISSVSCADTRYPPIGNHDCGCFSNNLGRVDTLVSLSPKVSKQVFFGRGQEVFTGVILVMILLNIIVFKLRQLHETSLTKNEKPQSLSSEHLCRRFLLSEMQLATNSFDQSMIIGKGGFEEWQTEVKLSSELSHPNISKLLGYCSEDLNLLLVYELIYKGSLETYILKKGFEETLSWSMRVNIMMGTAKGIAYLHSRENQIILRDLKTSNILLDQDFNAKIVDFGLARRGPIDGETHLITQVTGTYGYAAPEYVATGYLNGKNDIYAFGVVLLETLTGLRVFDKTRPENKQDLVKWAKPMLPQKKKLMTIVDPSLGNDYPQEAIYQWAKLILKCTQTEPKDRPCIEQVLQRLERISCIKPTGFFLLDKL